MSEEFVTVRGEKYYVKDDTLDLSGKEITDIDEIKELEILTEIKWLELNNNQIKEISGLEELTNLQYLRLCRNQIEEIKGLENLTNLKILDLSENPIRDDERHLLGKSAQKVVKYCQEKANKAQEGD
jgi:Leucine-rich repeat (LRR) protein